LNNYRVGIEDLIHKTSSLISYNLRYSDYEELKLAVHLGYNVMNVADDDAEDQKNPETQAEI
jgi:hypothetical protein